jgi:hypothetical protein
MNLRDEAGPFLQRVEVRWELLNVVTQATHRLDFDARLECSETVDETLFKLLAVELCVVIGLPSQRRGVSVDLIDYVDV